MRLFQSSPLTLLFCVSILASSLAESLELDDGLASGAGSAPVMISPTRLKQSKHDIPAPVSVIDRAEIEALQLRTLPEALGYITGMAIRNHSGHDVKVNYHGTSSIAPRRMQILLDGMSVFRAGYAEIVWSILPVTLNDIERIEVTRSPSSPTYGQNAMMAVINLITRSPLDNSSNRAMARLGSNSTRDGHFMIQAGNDENLYGWLSLASQMDEGFDNNAEGNERRDGLNMNHLNGRVKWQINPITYADFYAGFSHGVREIENRDSGQISFPDTKNKSQYYNFRINHTYSSRSSIEASVNHIQIDQDLDWDTCYPLAFFLPSLSSLHSQNPGLAQQIIATQSFPAELDPNDAPLAYNLGLDLLTLGSSGLSPTCGTVNENTKEVTTDFEIENTWLFSDTFQAVFGVGATNVEFNSETFFGGKQESRNMRLFTTAEYRLARAVFNIGIMGEYDEHDNQLFFSPRAGINYRLSEALSVRYGISKALRTPDPFETSNKNWTYTLRNANQPLNGNSDLTFYYVANQDGNLKPEEIISNEIGLYYFDKRLNGTNITTFEVDIKAYYDEMNNLISEKIQFFDYQPTNNSENILHGFEIDFNYTLTGNNLPFSSEQISAHVSYAYMDMNNTNEYERALYSRHLSNFYVIAYFPKKLSLAVGYNGNSAREGEAHDSYQFSVKKSFPAPGGTIYLGFKTIYQPDTTDFIDTGALDRVIVNDQNSSTSYFGTLTYSF